MSTDPPRAERRSEALSRQVIVDAAIGILDEQGEAALTFRALTARLSTGAGAIYWHVANKNELLVATTDDVIERAIAGADAPAEPFESIRAIALGVFEAIDAHPWVGAQLSREPWQPAVLQILAALGSRLEAAGVPERAQFNAASALLNYFLGLAGQYAAAARLTTQNPDRATFLVGIAERFRGLASSEGSFMDRVAAQLGDHDDRDQFVAGVDLILAGIAALE